MAKARKILRRLRSIRNIHEVTRAMYMISTARFKRAHDRIGAARPFLVGVMGLAADVAAHAREGQTLHPLLGSGEERVAGILPAEAGPRGKGVPAAKGGPDALATRGPEARHAPGDTSKPAVLLVISSRRGLCGSYNNAVADLAVERVQHYRAAGLRILLRTSGKRGQHILEALDHEIDRAYPEFDRTPDHSTVLAMADELMAEFLGGRIAGLEVAYTQFVSAGQQKPAIARVLPLDLASLPVYPGAAPGAAALAAQREPAADFFPTRDAVVSRLIPEAVRAKLFQCFLDASASEHAARMTAMKYASENAEELIHELTVSYNRARQSQITMELAEIMGGRAGVEGM